MVAAGLGSPLTTQSTITLVAGLIHKLTPTSSETNDLSNWESHWPGAGNILWLGKAIRGDSEDRNKNKRKWNTSKINCNDSIVVAYTLVKIVSSFVN